jgi:N-acetyl-anhydromuramyl-L-alanine amidase AmpD
MKIVTVPFSAKHYINRPIKKRQIYLHHTAGGPSGQSVFNWWASNAERVATFVAISADGTIVQGFDSSKWAYHLGLSVKHFNAQKLKYNNLDQLSIGIEICNWGPVTVKGTGTKAKYYNYVGKELSKDEVIKLSKPFKGYQYWHNYTDEQISSLKDLLIELNKKHGIPLDYNEDIWGVTHRALTAVPGVYTHNSVRRDKSDVYPHPKLIEMLQSLTK